MNRKIMFPKSVVFYITLHCSLCNKKSIFFGEDPNKSIKQAKINSYINASENKWYIHHSDDGHICNECCKISGSDELMDKI